MDAQARRPTCVPPWLALPFLGAPWLLVQMPCSTSHSACSSPTRSFPWRPLLSVRRPCCRTCRAHGALISSFLHPWRLPLLLLIHGTMSLFPIHGVSSPSLHGQRPKLQPLLLLSAPRQQKIPKCRRPGQAASSLLPSLFPSAQASSAPSTSQQQRRPPLRRARQIGPPNVNPRSPRRDAVYPR
jgi:hypothetical protein